MRIALIIFGLAVLLAIELAMVARMDSRTGKR